MVGVWVCGWVGWWWGVGGGRLVVGGSWFEVGGGGLMVGVWVCGWMGGWWVVGGVWERGGMEFVPLPILALFHKPKYNTRQSTSDQQIWSQHNIMRNARCKVFTCPFAIMT